MTEKSDNYELLNKEIHEALLKNDGVENIKVLHNVKIKGKSGATHQIDVYWEFKLAGVKHKTCIECKYLNSPVKKLHVAAFSATLDDIGNATGVFATSHHYQKGAKLFAKEKGIRLILVNYLFKTICIQGNFIIPNLEITSLIFDKENSKEALKANNLTSYNYSHRVSGEDSIYDKKGKKRGQLKDIISPLLSNKPGKGSLNPEETYYKTEIGKIKISSIGYRITHSETKWEQTININDVSNAILEDVLENSVCYLNDDGSITKVQSHP